MSGVPLGAIHKAIDEGPLESARARRARKRTLTETDLLYLAASSLFDPNLVQLTEQAKSRLRKAIASQIKSGKTMRKLVLFEGWSST